MRYTSKSQLARVNTEFWMASHGYCLACESDTLLQTAANTQVRDFECPKCSHPNELKGSSKPFGRTLVDGAYASMMRRFEADTVPSFLLMHYSSEHAVTDQFAVNDLMAIHRSFITPEVIRVRKPLAPSARRAGWIGCNLLLDQVPPEGRVWIIQNRESAAKQQCRKIFMATNKLISQPSSDRGWAGALLRCLHQLPNSIFTLEQAYQFEAELSSRYPHNSNIRAKIRQQLQVLRDARILVFEGRGLYRLSIYDRLIEENEI